MEFSIAEHIQEIDRLVKRYGIEFDYYSWNEIKTALQTRCPNLIEDKDKIWRCKIIIEDAPA